MSATESSVHLVAVPLQAWGHTRPLTGLIARLAQNNPSIIVTFFVPMHLYERVDIELSRHLGDAESVERKRIRLFALPCTEENVVHLELFYAAFAAAYSLIVEGKPVSCARTGVATDPAPPPASAIIDIFMLPAADIVRKHTHKVKVFCFVPGAVISTFRVLHKVLEPFKAGNLGDLRTVYERRAAESGESLENIVGEALVDLNGELIKIPGLPPMYDYEQVPQIAPDFKESPLLHLALIESMVQCEGFITASPECIDSPEASRALQDWYSKTSKRIYFTGPLMPLGRADAAEKEKTTSADAAGIFDFLAHAIENSGPRKVVYMSFGSLFWPSEPSKLWIFMDVLLEKEIPFIFCHSSPFSSVPEEVVNKVNKSGLGLLTPWAPQQTVLAHPAVGWFISHGGFNSIVEAVVNGVPMISWPFSVDQPINAVRITENLDIAYELLEVRTGESRLRPIYRTMKTPEGTPDAVREEASTTLDRAFGEDGARKRANLMKLREKTLAAWDENGPSRIDVEALMKDML